MRLLFVILICLSANAHSQPAQWPGVGKTSDFITGKHGADDDGHRWAAWRYLSADGFQWRDYTAVLRRDKVLVSVPKVAGESIADHLNRTWAANGALACEDTAILSICDTAKAALKAIPAPTNPQFVVAKNGASITRPMYALNVMENTVGAQISKRAPVGNKCECAEAGVRKNGDAYCAVWIGASLIVSELAICTVK